MSGFDQVAEQNYKVVERLIMRLAEKAATKLISMGIDEVKKMLKRSLEISKAIASSPDPAKAMEERMQASLKEAKEQLGGAYAKGAISVEQYADISAKLKDLAEYNSLRDGCIRVATLDNLRDEIEKMNFRFGRGERDAFKNLEERVDAHIRLPHAVALEAAKENIKFPEGIDEVKANVMIKRAKEMERDIAKNAWKEQVVNAASGKNWR